MAEFFCPYIGNVSAPYTVSNDKILHILSWGDKHEFNQINIIMDNVLRIAAYARVSTDKNDQLNSFESQVRYFKEYIEKTEGWSLVKVYSDDGITGTTTQKRKGFREMLEDAFSGKIDLILTKEVSRFARNTLDSIRFTRELAQKNVFVIFTLDGIDTRQPDAELRLTIMAALAQEESRKTSERVKWGQTRQMEKGVVFGRDMLGYRVQGGQLFPDKEQAEIVKLIFHKYVHEGKGTYIIARELGEAGIRPFNPNKNDWSPAVILKVLRNEKYVGDLCQKKTWTKNYLDHKKRYNHGEEDMIYIKDHHPDIAIIDRETWNMAQKRLLSRNTSQCAKISNFKRYWASGKIFCGVCGESFVSKLKNTANGYALAWICTNHVKAKPFRKTECSMPEWVNDKTLKNCCLYILSEQIITNSKGNSKEIACYFRDDAKRTFFEPDNKITSSEENQPDEILSVIIERIVVNPGHILDIYLKDVPTGFKITYKASGRLQSYKTNILSCELMEKGLSM